jgi:hypothetical protein
LRFGFDVAVKPSDDAAIRQQMRSAASGKTGREQEFILCHETRQPR